MSSSLNRYKKKRFFSVTPEPRGRIIRNHGWSYVIQKHDASHLHYDFRLELDGVLKSWAVPKGPSLDPKVKRLAIEVEDHPVDYGSFEGVIPQGEYGGGTVLLWDQGTWSPVGNPHGDLRDGKLKFVLSGEKLHGQWMLVRSRSYGNAKKPQWLLMKEKDKYAVAKSKGDVLEEAPLSVTTGRDLNQIAQGLPTVKTSRTRTGRSPQKQAIPPELTHNSGNAKSVARKKTLATSSRMRKTPIRGAVIQAMPKSIDVQLATLTETPPEGDDWLHEVKFDGYRMICLKDHDKIQFISRNHQDWTSRLSQIVEGMQQFPVDRAIIDGEVVALNADGTSSFQKLQNAFRDSRSRHLNYYAFDLLYLNGESLIDVPLERRKKSLDALISQLEPNSPIRYSEHVEGSGEEFHQQACRLKLEGMISKRRNCPYQSGRGLNWLKVKCVKTEEFVIGGFTEPKGARSGFGALLVGYQNSDGLKYAGKVGTGFSQKDLASLTKQLKSLERTTSPFVDRRQKVGPTRSAHWVKPTLVGHFKYASRTDDNLLRHAAFLGLREDKSAKEVTRDSAVTGVSAPRSSKPQKKSSLTSTDTMSSERSKKSSTKSAEVSAKQEEFAGVRFTNPDKVLFPEGSITKQELAEYYQEVADWMLPHLAHRPVVLVRCPGGVKNECFYQKHPGVGTPEILRQIPVTEKRRTDNYLVIDNVSSLIAVAQIGTLEIHSWGSREDKLESPDRLIFDLDPSPEVEWPIVTEGAREIRLFLQELGLESFVKTTGGKGLHIVLPIERRQEWGDAKVFCKQVADAIVTANSSRYTTNLSKAARTGKIFIDYLRNGRGATSVAPYSTRSRPDATVSTPLTWSELSPKVTSGHFTLKSIPKRLASLKRDPWEDFHAVRQSISGPWKKLKSISGDAQ